MAHGGEAESMDSDTDSELMDMCAGELCEALEKKDKKGNVIKDDVKKYRLQAFEGIVLGRKHGKEAGATFTVRRVASGVGVERIFPLYSPMVDKIEVTKRSRARRSKLYYIRNKAIKDVRSKMRSVTNQEEETEVVAEKAAE